VVLELVEVVLVLLEVELDVEVVEVLELVELEVLVVEVELEVLDVV
jgi:hypothetical protein